jgi:hypothetical protein
MIKTLSLLSKWSSILKHRGEKGSHHTHSRNPIGLKEKGGTMRTRKHTTAYLFFLALILAAFFLGTLPGKACAWSDNPYVNTPICTESSGQSYPQIISDSSGGAIIAWEDKRNGNVDIYV